LSVEAASPSGAKASVCSGPSGMAEAVPFPKT
jgi:hypothetical protein